MTKITGGLTHIAKQTLFLKTLLFIVVIFSGSLLIAAENKLKVAVLEFKTVGDAAELGEGAAEILRTTLMETGKYTVVERGMLKQVLEEQKLGLSGVVDQNTAVGIGKILGAKLVAVGSVVKMGESYTLNIRFVDVQTGEVVTGKKLTAQSREDIPALCSQMVKMLRKSEGTQEQEEEAQSQQIPNHRKMQSFEAKHTPNSGNWAVGLLYPGAAIKYVTNGTTAWELRAQSGLDILAFGGRYYQYFSSASDTRLFCGIDAEYVTYKGESSKGLGFAGGAFAGGEILLTKQIGLLVDFGPMYIKLNDKNASETVGGIEYVVNMGIYWHFK